MPSRVRQVDFAPTPAYSRLPHDDEMYVMKAFARHASHCSTCANPYEVHREGGTLCSKGHSRAIDVAQYLYSKGGQSFSKIDLEGSNRVQIEIPADCEAVRGLLKAMERGLRLRRKVQPVSYDSTYEIRPRKLPSDYGTYTGSIREPRYIRKPSLETAEPPPSKSYSGRGSLWEQDQKERERRHKKQQQPAYYRAMPHNPPPVPPKDGYWR
ncbi:MAG: hypothetical protein Q9190_000046 [Brigantiaea leucoxantha]